MFIERTRNRTFGLMSRRSDVRLAVMLMGLEIADRTALALATSTEGVKVSLGLELDGERDARAHAARQPCRPLALIRAGGPVCDHGSRRCASQSRTVFGDRALVPPLPPCAANAELGGGHCRTAKRVTRCASDPGGLQSSLRQGLIETPAPAQAQGPVEHALGRSLVVLCSSVGAFARRPLRPRSTRVASSLEHTE